MQEQNKTKGLIGASSSSSSPLHNLTSSTNPPRLVILQQTCLAEENYTVNGEKKNVHVVVKNQPFFVHVALLGG